MALIEHTATAAALAEQATLATMTAAAVTAVAAIAAVAAVSSHRFVFAAEQGEAHDREKYRDTKNYNSIHPKILQKTYRYRKRARKLVVAVSKSRPPAETAHRGRIDLKNPCDYALCISKVAL
jgi:hypothetical protein